MRALLLAVAILLASSGTAWSEPAPADSVEARLCRSQLELLVAGNKLTDEEAKRFDRQCACLEQQDGTGSSSECAQRAE